MENSATLAENSNMGMSSVPNSLRHPTHYYDDGNIIFVVGEGRTHFRLYRGILARHSEVMRNMFAMPTGTLAVQETVEGVPVVTLTDSENDFACLLDFLFCPNVPPYPPDAPHFEALLSVLRISTKYMFDNIRERALFHLRECIPTTLEDYERDPSLSWFTGIKASQAIAMAREFDLPEFLRLSFYAIAVYPWHSLEAADQVYSALPPGDLARMVVGRNALQQQALSLAFGMHEHGLSSHTSCTNPVSITQSCAKGKPSVIWDDPEGAMEELLRNPLKTLNHRQAMLFRGRLCKACVESMRVKMAADFVDLYDKLPDIFQF